MPCRARPCPAAPDRARPCRAMPFEGLGMAWSGSVGLGRARSGSAKLRRPPPVASSSSSYASTQSFGAAASPSFGAAAPSFGLAFLGGPPPFLHTRGEPDAREPWPRRRLGAAEGAVAEAMPRLLNCNFLDFSPFALPVPQEAKNCIFSDRPKPRGRFRPIF